MKMMPSSSNTGMGVANTSMELESTQYGSHNVPPFEATKNIYPLTNTKGHTVVTEINAKIDKGFFKADQDWTCYRRNYFSVACSYTLTPTTDMTNDRLYLYRVHNAPEKVENIHVCITAKVDGEDGKVIDLVQHTPKRDKGPMSAPEMIKLLPNQSGLLPSYSGSSSGLSPNPQLSSDYEGFYAGSPSQGQNQVVANFDRIQFKKATANNGKRRAAQQYFHIVVELFAEVPKNKSSENQCIKIASRISAPMVVRGRSPGHYQDERRGSSTSMGPGGGSSGDSAGGPRDPTSAGSSRGSHGNVPGISLSGNARLANSTYQTHRALYAESPSNSHSLPSSTSSSVSSTSVPYVNRPVEPILTAEEANNIEEHHGYQYYPSTLFETPTTDNSNRPQLPPMNSNPFKHGLQADDSRHETSFGYLHGSSITSTKQDSHAEPRAMIKQEKHQNSDGGFKPYTQSPTFGAHYHARSNNDATTSQLSCGRFQGMETSRGYYSEMPAL